MASLLTRLGSINFIGDVHRGKDISAIDLSGDFIVIGSDEGNQVQVLKRHGVDYDLVKTIVLNKDAIEIDVEGIACEGNTVYVVGSHSCKRKKIESGRSYDENRRAIETVIPEPDRDLLCRFRLDNNGETHAVEKTSLRPIINNSSILRVFSDVPSKENGIDIEGIAVHKGQIYIGFRGPVLRGNWVPVLKCQFAQPITTAELIFVNLGGRGFRDITHVDHGFLILAGPVGDGSDSYQVYFWDGEDCLPRSFGDVGKVKFLGEVPPTEAMKAEGLALLKENSSNYEVLIVYDSIKNGNPTRFRIPKP